MGNLCCCNCINQEEERNEFSVVPGKDQYQGSRDFLRRRHGNGTYFYANGDIYDGQWHRDKKHGHGEYRFTDGRIIKGYFVNDHYVGSSEITSYEEKENILFSSSSARPLMSSDILSQEGIKNEKTGNVSKIKKLRISAGKKIGKLKETIGISTRNSGKSDSYDGRAKSPQDPLNPSQDHVTYAAFRDQGNQERKVQMEEYQTRAREEERRRKEYKERAERHRELRENIRKKYNLPDHSSTSPSKAVV